MKNSCLTNLIGMYHQQNVETNHTSKWLQAAVLKYLDVARWRNITKLMWKEGLKIKTEITAQFRKETVSALTVTVYILIKTRYASEESI
jgi:hypothetical protein